MAYRLPPLNALRAFEAAARHGSFKLAAEELHVTPAAVSHQVKALEDYLGVKLFLRLVRSLRITEEGRAALPKLREGFECLEAAVERMNRHGDTGILTVSVPPSFAARWLVPRLNLFTTAHPEVNLRIFTSPAAVDRDRAAASLEATPMDPGEPLSDVSIRFGAGRYPGCRVDKLFSVDYVPVCSPALLTGRHPLRQPEDLRRHMLLHDDTIPDVAERPGWEEWLKTAGVQGVDGSRGPRFNGSVLALEAAEDGLGVALGMRPMVAQELAQGRLVIPFDISIPSRYAYYLVCGKAVAERPAVAPFRHWLLREAACDVELSRPGRTPSFQPV